MDKYIRVKNCNCISDATIEIVEKSLNIKYGSNGTGKSTISEAIYAQANNETDRLKDFKPYGSNDNSQPTVDNPYFHVVKVFNEERIEQILKGEKTKKPKSTAPQPIKVKGNVISRFFTKQESKKEIEETIEKALELYFARMSEEKEQLVG